MNFPHFASKYLAQVHANNADTSVQPGWQAGHKLVSVEVPIAYRYRRVYATARAHKTNNLVWEIRVRCYRQGSLVFDYPLKRTVDGATATYAAKECFFPTTIVGGIAAPSIAHNSILVMLPEAKIAGAGLSAENHLLNRREFEDQIDLVAIEVVRQNAAIFDAYIGVESLA